MVLFVPVPSKIYIFMSPKNGVTLCVTHEHHCSCLLDIRQGDMKTQYNNILIIYCVVVLVDQGRIQGEIIGTEAPS